jgi:hypothetical protein
MQLMLPPPDISDRVVPANHGLQTVAFYCRAHSHIDPRVGHQTTMVPAAGDLWVHCLVNTSYSQMWLPAVIIRA